jgi:hypothetical protein
LLFLFSVATIPVTGAPVVAIRFHPITEKSLA